MTYLHKLFKTNDEKNDSFSNAEQSQNSSKSINAYDLYPCEKDRSWSQNFVSNPMNLLSQIQSLRLENDSVTPPPVQLPPPLPPPPPPLEKKISFSLELLNRKNTFDSESVLTDTDWTKQNSNRNSNRINNQNLSIENRQLSVDTFSANSETVHPIYNSNYLLTDNDIDEIVSYFKKKRKKTKKLLYIELFTSRMFLRRFQQPYKDDNIYEKYVLKALREIREGRRTSADEWKRRSKRDTISDSEEEESKTSSTLSRNKKPNNMSAITETDSNHYKESNKTAIGTATE